MHTSIHTTCFSKPPEWFWQESPKWIVKVPHQIPQRCHLVQNHSLKLISSERKEVEFPLINGSGGFNLSMVPSEVHHKVDVYVRVAWCETQGNMQSMMNISEFDMKLWWPSENTAHSLLPRMCQAQWGQSWQKIYALCCLLASCHVDTS